MKSINSFSIAITLNLSYPTCQDLDETLMERLWGLTEMFPERLRTSTVNAASSTVSLVKGEGDDEV